jgi:uncharacterized protein (DUF1800 family)
LLTARRQPSDKVAAHSAVVAAQIQNTTIELSLPSRLGFSAPRNTTAGACVESVQRQQVVNKAASSDGAGADAVQHQLCINLRSYAVTLQTVDTDVEDQAGPTSDTSNTSDTSDTSRSPDRVVRSAPPETTMPAPLPVLGALMASVAAAACGGGDDGAAAQTTATGLSASPSTESPSLASNAQPAVALPFDVFKDKADVVRLLAQGGFGGNRAEVDRVFNKLGSASAWIDEQLGMRLFRTHQVWLTKKTIPVLPENGLNPPGTDGMENTVWRAFINNDDQLRHRMVYALSQILVVSTAGLDGARIGWLLIYYMDVLYKNAFGNFRDLLEAVTLSPAMGRYLSMKGSQRAVPNGRQPDENYAREIMQLFTIGLVELNADGTPKLVKGKPVDSYTQDDVAGLARVFTGWDEKVGTAGGLRFVTSMVNNADLHEKGEKRFLGVTVPANTSARQSLGLALDRLCSHDNVGPFIGKQLIQRLVTSNPSPAYVGRVSAVFKNTSGDLKAVLRAILTDSEARNTDAVVNNPNGGKLREPVLRFLSWARACNVKSVSGDWLLSSLNDPAKLLGQSPLRAASVFNFYRPGYVPPNTALAKAGKVAPEFQITTETSVAGYLNFMQSAVANGNSAVLPDLKADYGEAWFRKAGDPAGLVAEANLLLAANQLSPAHVSLIGNAVAAMPSKDDADLWNRVYAAVFLTLASPECLVAK